MAKIMVRRTKLFYDGNADEAPAGSTFDFNLLESDDFQRHYGYRTIERLDQWVAEQLEKWNKMQPKNWRYELM